jgi:polyhydroxybutyrate depolymerase
MRILRGGCAAATAIMMLGPVVIATSSAGPASASGCTLASTNGTITRTMATRTYNLHVPAGLTGTSVPLLISNPGAGNTAAMQESDSGWSPYADSHHFVVAYTQAVNDYFDYEQGSYDVTYIKNVVSDIEASWCIDTHRVFNDGWSNGAIMSQRMACDAATVFASVTSWEGGDPTIPNGYPPTAGTPCAPIRPIAVGIFQGQIDPVSNSVVGQQNVNSWVSRDGCPPSPTNSTDAYGTLARYQPCRASVALWWRVESNVTHEWPGASTGQAAIGQDLRDRLWTFLTSFTLP